MLEDTNVSNLEYSILSGPAMLCISAISLMPLSRYSENSSRPKLLLILFSSAAALLTSCNSFATDFYTLLWPRVLFSVSSSPISPLNLRIMTDYFSSTKRGIGSGIYFLSVYIGLSLASLTLLLSVVFGWRLTYVGLGAASLVVSLVVGCLIPKVKVQQKSSTVKNDLQSLYSNKTLVLCVTGLAFKYISQFTRASFESLYFVRAFPDYVETYSILNTIGLLICPWSAIILGKLADNLEVRYPLIRIYMCAITLIIPLPFFISMYLTSSFEFAMVCVLLASLISEAYISLSYSIMINVTLPHIRALQTAWMMSITMVAGSVAIVIIGYTYNQLQDLRIALVVSSTVPLVLSSIFFFTIVRYYKNDLKSMDDIQKIRINDSVTSILL